MNLSLVTRPASFTLVLAAGLLTHAEDWPQWGGNDPGRNFYSPAKGLPDRFEPGKFKSGTEEIDLATTKLLPMVSCHQIIKQVM